MTAFTETAALWWAVVGIGLYHGLNPGMGWPLAVSSALMERRAKALAWALVALAAGHFVSMTVILLPFAAMTSLVEWEREIRIAAATLVIGMGIYLLINRRHPRFLSRVPPTRMALWSFLAALAHGAGLMLVPMYLGLCRIDEVGAGHGAAITLMADNATTALSVAVVHTLAMITAGGLLAAIFYFWVGLKFLSRTWLNLDLVWALSLVAVGVIALAAPHAQV